MTAARRKRLLVTLNDEEHTQIKATAAMVGMSMSRFLRVVGLGHQPKSILDHERVRVRFSDATLESARQAAVGGVRADPLNAGFLTRSAREVERPINRQLLKNIEKSQGIGR